MINVTIQPNDDIQNFLDILQSNGGGVLNITPATYSPTASITSYDNIIVNGNGAIIDFGGQNYQWNVLGSDSYSTGTITSIVSGVNVTGSGTAWLTNVTPYVSQLFFKGQWMTIASVPTDTTLVLAEGYDGVAFAPGASYVIATPIKNIGLQNFTIQNSLGVGIEFNLARFIDLQGINSLSNNIGIKGTYVTELSINRVLPILNTTNGMEITNGGRFNWDSVNSASNGTNGIYLNNVRSMGFKTGVANSNTEEGMYITNCTDISATNFDASANGKNGVNSVSGNYSLSFTDGAVRSNTEDGIKETASSVNTFISNIDALGNSGYDINIVDATSVNTIILGNTVAGDGLGTVNDLGTGTLIRSNIGVADN